MATLEHVLVTAKAAGSGSSSVPVHYSASNTGSFAEAIGRDAGQHIANEIKEDLVRYFAGPEWDEIINEIEVENKNIQGDVPVDVHDPYEPLGDLQRHKEIEETRVTGKKPPPNRINGFQITQQVLGRLISVMRPPGIGSVVTAEEFAKMLGAAEADAGNEPPVRDQPNRNVKLPFGKASVKTKETATKTQTAVEFDPWQGYIDPNKPADWVATGPFFAPNYRPDPNVQPGIEEITVTAPRLDRLPNYAHDFPVYVPDLPPVYVDYPVWAPDWFIPNPRYPEVEEPLKTEVPEVDPAPVQNPNPAEDLRPLPESIPNPDSPYLPKPESVPRPDPLPEPHPMPEVALNLQPNLKGGIKLEINLGKPTDGRFREPNKPRKDGKRNNNRLYRAGMMFISRTFGTATEIMDLYEVIANNTYIQVYKGPGLVNSRTVKMSELSPLTAAEALRDNDYYVDWEQMLVDYSYNQAMDRVIGEIGTRYAKSVNQSNWYGGIRSNPFYR